jgi:hypothetical protein
MNYKCGSFNWYLYQSGGFVITVAKAITLADVDNKERLRKAFPQMCAAHDCSSWDTVPDGFEPKYNAEAK